MKKIKFLISAFAISGLLSTVSIASDDERDEEKDPSCCAKIAQVITNNADELIGAAGGYIISSEAARLALEYLGVPSWDAHSWPLAAGLLGSVAGWNVIEQFKKEN